MNVDTARMASYAEFLEDNSQNIQLLCSKLEQTLSIATQCMDQRSGLVAAQRMIQNLENVKKNVPVNDDAVRRMILSLKYIGDAGNVFGR